jgi:hypothetical protein
MNNTTTILDHKTSLRTSFITARNRKILSSLKRIVDYIPLILLLLSVNLRLTAQDPFAKKGVGIGYHEGGTSIPAHMADLMDHLNIAWYYNWGFTPHTTYNGPIEFVPMWWGYHPEWGPLQQTLDKLDVIAADTSIKTILGFNEPDAGGQANMTVESAIEMWPHLVATGKRLGSPACAAYKHTLNNNGWLDRFMKAIDADSALHVDFICVHHYQVNPNVNNLVTFLQDVYDKYQLPIWLTEWSLAQWHGMTQATEAEQVAYLKEAAIALEALPFLERHAWFSYEDSEIYGVPWDMGLVTSEAPFELTPVGEVMKDLLLPSTELIANGSFEDPIDGEWEAWSDQTQESNVFSSWITSDQASEGSNSLKIWNEPSGNAMWWFKDDLAAFEDSTRYTFRFKYKAETPFQFYLKLEPNLGYDAAGDPFDIVPGNAEVGDDGTISFHFPAGGSTWQTFEYVMNIDGWTPTGNTLEFGFSGSDNTFDGTAGPYAYVDEFALLKTALTYGNFRPYITEIDDLIFRVGFDKDTLDIDATDKNGDVVSIALESSHEDVVTVSKDLSKLIIAEVGEGISTITITASDGNGGVSSMSFEVKVMSGSGTEMITNSSFESTIDGYWSAWSDQTQKYNDYNTWISTDAASHGDKSVKIWNEQPGKAMYWYKEDLDIFENARSYTFSFKYKAGTPFCFYMKLNSDIGYDVVNDPKDILPDTIEFWGSDVKFGFAEDNSQWNEFEYTFEINGWNPTSNILEFGFAGNDNTFDGTDGPFAYIDEFSLLVDTINAAPILSAIADLEVDQGFVSTTKGITVSDANGDEIALSAISSDESVVTVSITGNTLTITEVGAGISTITLLANDGNGETTTTSFVITVKEAVSLGSYTRENIWIYPNPASGNIYIDGFKESQASVSIFNILGTQLIHQEDAKESVDISSLNRGIYILRLTLGDGTSLLTRFEKL